MPMKEQMPRFVEERKPKVVIGKVAEAQLQYRFSFG